MQIAEVLGWKVEDVFRAAGYLPPMEQLPTVAHEEEIQAAMRRVQRVLNRVPEDEWPIAYQITLAYLDGLQNILNRLDGH